MKSVKTWKKLLSVVLSSAIIVTTLAPGAVASAAENPSVQQGAEVLDFDGTSTDISSADQTENSSKNAPAEQNADDAVTPDEGSNAQDTPDAAAEADDSAAVKEQQSESAPAENEAQTKAAADTNLYQDGSICIYNEQQLRAIGNGAQVYEGDASADTFGTGAALTKEDGSALTYAADGTYTLMNDIPLTKGSVWTLPEGFAGAFNDAEVTEDAPLYDAETDTIYVYHQYQLATINDPEALKTVMSKDMIAKDFGVGQVVYEDADQAIQLEYTDEHNYVVSKDFTEEMPELTATEVQSDVSVQLGGRDYIGQSAMKIGGETYILIGNEQQLRAIGEDVSVAPMLFLWHSIVNPGYEPYYPGDADLNITDISQAGLTESVTGDYGLSKDQTSFTHTGTLLGNRNIGDGGLVADEYLISIDENGNKVLVGDNTDAGSIYKGLKYTRDANYIIFRDINLEEGIYSDGQNSPWTPLMFSGNMIGAIADESHSLSDVVSQSIDGTADVSVQATISNISINSEKIDVQNTSGVGFFATISNTSDTNIGFSDGAVSVRNLKLQNVSVSNNVEKIEDKTGLIQTLLDKLGSLGAILLGKLGDALKVILNPDANSDDTVFATGAFAGRIQGEVIVENCTVDTINNLTSTYHGMTGGFVGNVEGMTQYGELQGGLESIGNILEKLLNIIPLLDLGTLINILLDGNIIDPGELIPTGYYNPQIINCHVTGDTLTISNAHDFNGGFAGRQVGAIIKDSSVSVNTLTVSGKNLTGGFSGVEANAELVGVLDDLGVDLVKSNNLSSYLLNCNVNAETATITASEKYAGGLAGSMNNSFSVDSGLNIDESENAANVSVTANEYAGGITGYASIAQSISLGSEFYEGRKNLGTLLSNIISKTLSSDDESCLLSLTGVSPSYIAGNKINGNLTVLAKQSYAGGIAGAADGVQIIPSSKLSDAEEGSFIWKYNSEDLNYSPENQDNLISALVSVQSKEYSGGIIGKSLTASAAGILNKTLGIGNYLGFTVDSVTLTGAGDGYTVAAAFENNTGDYAGGAFGQAIGGDVVNVKLDNISSVTAKNYAGGFVGDAGTGSLVDGGGLNLLGLNLVKIDDLFSLAEGVVLNISNSSVTGAGTEENKIGLSVSATGSNSDGAVEDFAAGGFIGESKSVIAENCTVNNLKSVRADGKAGYAGGFTGTSESGGLADIAENENGLKGIASLSDLLSAADYLIPEYNNCHVTYVTNTAEDGSELPQVQAAVAGGFVGELTGGKVNVTKDEEDKTAVTNIENVKGTYFAGGFAGLATSGGLAETGGLSLLGGTIKLGSVDSLISVLEVYMPVINYAGVSAGEKGLVVSASEKMAAKSSKDESTNQEPNADLISSNSGSAGGYVGYGCGVRIADSDVIGLRATDVAAPDPLRSEKGESYFGADSKYAVTAPRYAGGYAGKLDIGNAASLGSGLGVDILGIKVTLEGVTDVLAAVASKIENSDVSGKTGGFSVLANEKKENVYTGHAGGYVGMMSGAEITSSNVDQFNYIIGGASAGGYAGTLEPGNVASVLGDAGVLGKLIKAENLLSVLQTFVPKITTSTTGAVPCGGVVRAENGSAGGYAGHSLGGQIKGSAEQESAILRLRSVYGQNYAGGFTGFAEAANTADTGNLKILGGIIKLENPLSAMQAVYAVEENTAVYGPLHNMDVDMWNGWVENIGSKGPYGSEFAGKTFEGENAQEELNEFLAGYTYGYEVISPGSNEQEDIRKNGYAGGYVGKMTGAHITNGQAHDLMSATAWNSAGGFAGVMTPGSLASIGGIGIADLDITQGLDVLGTFVSVVKQSGVSGYRTGASVEATGYKEGEKAGYAGGFVGNMIGGQIWGETTGDGEEQISHPCRVTNVNLVKAKNAVGGFAGQILPGSAASVDTSSSNAILDGLLNHIIGTKGDLASILKTTLSTVRNVTVTTDNGKGIVVQGAYNDGKKTAYAETAGGFAGTISGAIINDKDDLAQKIVLENLKTVNGGEYSGGFAGKADVSAVAEISGQSDTSILGNLLDLGGIDILDILRPYIYNAEISGVENYGFEVKTNTAQKLTDKNEEAGLYSGSAGGFIGALLCGTVENSRVSDLRSVEGVNYTGGFVGHTGKSGLVDADGADVLDKLLGVGVGVADVIGSDVKNSNVTGIDEGFNVKSSGGEGTIAGGFVGYADLGRMEGNTVDKLKQVYSDEIAGGFVGKTSVAYLVEVKGSGVAVNLLSDLLDALLDKLLHIEELEEAGVIKIDLGILEVDALRDGKLLKVNLLGLPITASLVEGSTQLKVTIGDSEITLGYDSDDPTISDDDLKNALLQINLIKANRTRIADSTVTGISIGYDVFGGGAGNEKDGTHNEGYAGGFVGYNDEGLFETNQMYYADTIRGTKGLVGEFSGQTSLKTVYEDFNNLDAIEGTDNIYRVYRKEDKNNLTQVYSDTDVLLNNPATENPDDAKAFDRETIDDTSYYVYGIEHRKDGIKESSSTSLHKAVWESAYQKAEDKNAEFSINVFVSDAQADLMLGTPTYVEKEDPDYADEEMQDPCDEEIQLTVQKIWIDDEGNPVEKPDQVEFEVYQNGEPYKPYKPEGEDESLKIVLTPENAEEDPNSWVTTVSVPFKAPDGKEYSYSVKETGAAGNDDYVTIYPAAEEDGHLICVINFQVSELVQEDSVVIDYGLPVDIDVLANDRVDEYGINGSLTSVKNKDGDTSSDENPTVSGRYGEARVETKSEGTKVIEYKPTSMSMDSFDEFSYSVQLDKKVTGNDNTVVEGSLSIIPATEIYYEDNFDAIQYTNGDAGAVPAEDETSEGAEDKYANSGVWEEVKVDSYSEGRHQDEDRPGTEELKGALDNIYGNDTSYTDDKVYSGGSSHKVKVSLANLAANGGTSPKASFTFTGTGFDVISVTDGYTGAVRVTVKDAVTKKTVTSKSVNTYYGYTYSEEGGWQVQEEPTGALYQIPVIKIEGLEQKTYDVEIVPTYIAMFDQKDRGYYNFYLDAIRIYDPADPDSVGNEIIKEAYQADGEYDSDFAELRNLLLNAGELTEESDAAPGVVFVDGNKAEVDLSEYTSRGPNNEVYLMHDQAIAFYLKAESKPETIQLSAKLAMGQEAAMKIAFAVEEDSGWREYNSETITVTSAYDMHYDISEQCMWTGDEKQGYWTKYPIVIRNASKVPEDGNDTGAVLSLTNLNWTAADMSFAEPLDTSLQIVADRNAALAAYSLVEVKPDQSITVQYLDTEGNILADAAVQSVQKGSEYNVADLTEKSIEGYTIQEIRGDAVQGTADTDKVIQVIYTVQECSIVVAYVDRNGNTIADPYVETVSYGNSYDVKRETIKKIWGYRQAETAGDEIKGVAKGDVNITVIYDKEKNIVTEIVHTVIDTVGNWLSSIFGR